MNYTDKALEDIRATVHSFIEKHIKDYGVAPSPDFLHKVVQELKDLAEEKERKELSLKYSAWSSKNIKEAAKLFEDEALKSSNSTDIKPKKKKDK